MALIMKKLAQTQPGARVEIGYGEDQRLTGVVADNDGYEEIEIAADNGQELIIRYSEVKVFRLLTAYAAAPQAPVPPAPAPAPTPVQTPAFFLSRPDSLMPTDTQLRDWFKALPKEEKKKITGKFDSFMAGIRQQDMNKCCQAAAQIQQELLGGGKPDRQAVYLCGQLLVRCKRPDPAVFERCGAFWEAAYLEVKVNHDAQRSGACAAAGLMQPQSTEQIDLLLTLLLEACQESQDASAVKWLDEQHAPIPPAHFDELIRVLLEDKGQAAQGGREACLRALSQTYPKTGMRELAESLMPSEKAREQAEEYFGEIVAVNSLLERGKLQYGEERLEFFFSDLADRELYDRLRQLPRSESLPDFFPVVFTLSDAGRPVRIQSDSELAGQSLLQYAQANWPDKRDAAQRVQAEPYLTRAVHSEDAAQALIELLSGSAVIFDSTGDAEPMRRAEALYRAHADRYTDRWPGVMPLATVYWKLHDYEQALARLEPAAADAGIYPRHRLSFYSQLTRIYLDRYRSSGKREDLKKALQGCKDWEKLYHENPELQAEPHIQNVYVNTTLSMMARCEKELGLLDDACRHIDLAAARNPASRDLIELRQEIRAARARIEQERAKEQQPEPVPETPAPAPLPECAEDQGNWPDTYTDESGWIALGLEKCACIDTALAFSGEGRFCSMLAYLKAASSLHEPITPVYTAVNLALDGPLDPPDYTPETLLALLDSFDRDYDALHRCCIAAAGLRAAFSVRVSNAYTLNTLRDSIELFHTIPEMRTVFEKAAAFAQASGKPLDSFADYRQSDAKTLAESMEALVQQAQMLYVQYVETPPRDSASLARLLETKKAVFRRDGYLACMLRTIIDADSSGMEKQRSRFVQDWIQPGKPVDAAHLSRQAIEDWMDMHWKQAGEQMNTIHQNSRLVSARRNNLRSGIHNILEVIASWYDLTARGAHAGQRDDDAAKAYSAVRPEFIERLTALRSLLEQQASAADFQLRVGLELLIKTVDDLLQKLEGTWNADSRKYFFVDFLHDDAIMLQEDFLPDLTSTFCALPRFNILARICAHDEKQRTPLDRRFAEICGQNRECCNFGTAALICRYLSDTGRAAELDAVPPAAEKYEAHAARWAEAAYRQFMENYALASSRGQIMLNDAFLTSLEDTIRYWYEQCRSTKNYGFFISLTEQIYRKIHTAAAQYGDQLIRQLASLRERNPELFQDSDAESEIRSQIEQQNFTVAEDWMNRLQRGEYRMDVTETVVAGWLGAFWDEYSSNFNAVCNAGVSLNNAQTRSGHRKDIRGGRALTNFWIKGKGSRAETISALLMQLGWTGLEVKEMHHPHISDDHYWVSAKHVAGRRNFPHPIADFGSAIARSGLMVVCLYGSYSTDGLLAKFRELDTVRGSKLILLDFALTEPERRKLARKMKEKESGLFGTYLLVDRVLIQFLARHYNATTINSMLLAVGMPFSYCQPYVADSTSTMPPEMFIGRKDELRQIESSNGVNLIYGGRQLGKSALFQKARMDLDGNEGCRAVLVDLSRYDCAKAARKLSGELTELGILPAGSQTEDWTALAAAIKTRLRSAAEPQIAYLLVMLDEADTFIESCKELEYQPITELKDIQQSLPGRFKFVLAGLHNIVRFNRDVALGRNAVITHLSSLNVRPFDFNAASELLTGPLRYLGFVLEDQVLISQILATTNYFPGLIQLYCKKMVESMRAPDYAGYNQTTTPPYVITDAHIKKVLSDSNFVAEIRDKFEITLRLDKDQGSYYYLLALLIGWLDFLQPAADGYRAGELQSKAGEWDLRALTSLSIEQIDALLEELRDLNILRATGAGAYLFASKNFRDLLGTAEEIETKLLEEGVR